MAGMELAPGDASGNLALSLGNRQTKNPNTTHQARTHAGDTKPNACLKAEQTPTEIYPIESELASKRAPTQFGATSDPVQLPKQ